MSEAVMKRKVSKKREKQTQYLSQAIQLEEAVNPHIIRATMSMVSLAILAFLLWAGFTNINEVARTPGEVVPKGHQQVVQHLEGGIIKEIHIGEGEQVGKGQVLVTLQDVSVKEDLERAKSKQNALELQAERLRAFVEGRELNMDVVAEQKQEMQTDQVSFFEGMKEAREKETEIIKGQITQKQKSISTLQSDLRTARSNYNITNDIYRRRKALNEKGYASDVQLLEDKGRLNQISGEIQRLKNQIEVAETEIQEYETRLLSLTAGHQDEALERLAEVTSEIEQNAKIIEKLQERIDRMDVRAPIDGLVQGLVINTVGAVLRPGEKIMEIVPLNTELEVEVKISPQDIGHLKLGQPVQVKFSTFDFSRYGSVRGELDYISPTTFASDGGERYYKGYIRLEKNYVGSSRANVIMPGMTVMADVVTGKKTILQYLLKPIHISLRTAFTER